MWLIPTRNRPQLMRDLITAIRKTGAPPEAAVMMDGCQYEDMDWPQNWHIHASKEHLEMGGSINALMDLHLGRPFYGLLTDHSRPLTQDWSGRLEREAGDWGIASSVNGKPRFNKRTGRQRLDCFAIGGKLVRALGYIWHPSMVHLYADDVLEDIGYSLGVLKFVPEVVFDELQLRDGTLRPDGNSQRVFRGRPYWPLDREAYARWLEHEFDQTISRLREDMTH